MKWLRRVGAGLSGLVTLFFVADAAGKLLKVEPVLQGTQQLGWPVTAVEPLGVVLLWVPCCTPCPERPCWGRST